MVKPYLLSILFLLSTNLFGQIKIAPVDFFWVNRVDSALNIIKTQIKVSMIHLLSIVRILVFGMESFQPLKVLVKL
jgi:hypothetical protein